MCPGCVRVFSTCFRSVSELFLMCFRGAPSTSKTHRKQCFRARNTLQTCFRTRKHVFELETRFPKCVRARKHFPASGRKPPARKSPVRRTAYSREHERRSNLIRPRTKTHPVESPGVFVAALTGHLPHSPAVPEPPRAFKRLASICLGG